MTLNPLTSPAERANATFTETLAASGIAKPSAVAATVAAVINWRATGGIRMSGRRITAAAGMEFVQQHAGVVEVADAAARLSRRAFNLLTAKETALLMWLVDEAHSEHGRPWLEQLGAGRRIDSEFRAVQDRLIRMSRRRKRASSEDLVRHMFNAWKDYLDRCGDKLLPLDMIGNDAAEQSVNQRDLKAALPAEAKPHSRTLATVLPVLVAWDADDHDALDGSSKDSPTLERCLDLLNREPDLPILISEASELTRKLPSVNVQQAAVLLRELSAIDGPAARRYLDLLDESHTGPAHPAINEVRMFLRYEERATLPIKHGRVLFVENAILAWHISRGTNAEEPPAEL